MTYHSTEMHLQRAKEWLEIAENQLDEVRRQENVTDMVQYTSIQRELEFACETLEHAVNSVPPEERYELLRMQRRVRQIQNEMTIALTE